jgi:small subunit ribosomal protein S16
MSVRIRLARGGTKKRPFYRIVATSSRTARDGGFLEKLGTYDPILPGDSPNRIVLREERIRYWLGVGAQPSDRVARFLDNAGITESATRWRGTGKRAEEIAAKKAAPAAKSAPVETAPAEPAVETATAPESTVEAAAAEPAPTATESAAEPEAAVEETAVAAESAAKSKAAPKERAAAAASEEPQSAAEPGPAGPENAAEPETEPETAAEKPERAKPAKPARDAS